MRSSSKRRASWALAWLAASLGGPVIACSATNDPAASSGASDAGAVDGSATASDAAVPADGAAGDAEPNDGAPLSDADAGVGAIRALDRGIYSRCALRANGDLDCVRAFAGHYDGGGYPTPFLTKVKAVGMGFYQHSALLDDGTVSRWTESDVDIGPAAVVPGVTGAIAVTGQCYLTSDKSVKCFDLAVAPTGGLTAVEALVSGDFDSCVITAAHTVKCWGTNFFGGLGSGDDDAAAASSSPVDVKDLSNVESISSFHGFSCVVLTDHTVKCWGDNSHGALGSNATGGFSSVPVTVAGLADVRTVSAGYHHACAILMSGRVQCWGEDDEGQLGNGSMPDSPTPVDVIGVTDAVVLAAGLSQTCAATSAGVETCWPAPASP